MSNAHSSNSCPGFEDLKRSINVFLLQKSVLVSFVSLSGMWPPALSVMRCVCECVCAFQKLINTH